MGLIGRACARCPSRGRQPTAASRSSRSGRPVARSTSIGATTEPTTCTGHRPSSWRQAGTRKVNMGMLIDVVYDEEGNIVALGFPPPLHQGNVQHRSGPEAGPGQTVAQFEL